MITLFCVRPRGFNIGNDTIYIGLRHLLREAFDGTVNLIQVPASGGAPGELTGLTARTIHEMNLYGHGVIVGGGNLYESGQLDVDLHALAALHPPLMLFSLSHGRIYDNRHELVPRTDSMRDDVIRGLHAQAASSVARDDATLEYLRSLGLDRPLLGGCPSLLVRDAVPLPEPAPQRRGTLLCIRHPGLMNIPLRDQARMHETIVSLITSLESDGFGPVRILCHDTRDVAFASSLGRGEYLIADDIYSHLALLRGAALVVTFRLHAFLPSLSFGTPAVNISYDERSQSLVRTIGLEEWDIDLIRTPDVVAEVHRRCANLARLDELREAAQPLQDGLIAVMREQVSSFARLAHAYASLGPPC